MFNIQTWAFKSMKFFLKVIMHYDVTGCVIFISNKIEYLEK